MMDVAGETNRSTTFDRALAHRLRERRHVQLERAIDDYYKAQTAAERAEDVAWAETGDDTVRRVWTERKR